MNKLKLVKIPGVAVLLIVTAALFWYFGTQPRLINLDSSTAQEVKAALARAYSVMALVACGPDTNVRLLDTVFVDTRDYRLSSAQLAGVTKIFGLEAAKNAGYLTTLKAYHLSMRGYQGNASANAFGNTSPTPRPYVYCPNPLPETKLTYESIAVSKDTAVVRYDDGPALQEAILALVDRRWFVSSIRAIWAHY